MYREELLQAVDVNLKLFIRRFMNNPFSFIYEEDARALLYVQLSGRIDMTVSFPTRNVAKKGILEETIQSSPWKAEYPRDDRGRFDIAFLDASGLNFYTLQASIGIEIKLGSDKLGTDQCGGFIGDFLNLVKYRDIRKQNSSNFLGIALYLYQTDDHDKIQQWFHNDRESRCPIVPNTFNTLQFSDDRVYAILACPPLKDKIYVHSQ